MQYAKTVPIGDRGNEQVDGRKPVVADPSELALRIDRTLLDLQVDVEVGESEQFGEQFVVLSSVPGGVAGLQEKRQARRDTPRFESRRRSRSLGRR